MTDNWTLLIHEPDAAPRSVDVVDGLTLGRHPNSSCKISHGTVSARHAKITEREGELVIQNTESNNGIRVDGTRVLRPGDEEVLRHGMQLRLGKVSIEVSAPEDFLPTMPNPTPAPDRDENRMRVSPGAQAAPRDREDSSNEKETILGTPGPTPPHPEPTPAQRPAPPPAPVVPAKIQSDPVPDPSSEFDTMALDTIVANAGPGADLGSKGAVNALGARLVIVNDADLRRVPITSVEFLVGRSSDCHCQLENVGVSKRHARIVFSSQDNLFLIEDLGSGNRTLLQKAPLPDCRPHVLEPDCYLRIGPIEAVFILDLDSDLRPLSPRRHESALNLLRAENKLTSSQLKDAEKAAGEEGITVAEALLLRRFVSPRDWADAVLDAKLVAAAGKVYGERLRFWRWAVLLIAAVFAILLALPQGRSVLRSLIDASPSTPSE